MHFNNNIICCFFRNALSLKDIIGGLCPPLRERYWYITNYVGLFFLMPYINLILNKLKDRELDIFCGLLVILFSVLPSLCFTDFFAFEKGYSLAWLIVCYILGCAMARRRIVILQKKEIPSFITIAFFLLAVRYGIYFLFDKQLEYLLSYNSPLVLLMAILILQCLVRYGEQKKTSNNKPRINSLVIAVSGVTFDIYLVHAHPLVYDYLIKDNFLWVIDYGWIPVLPLVCLCVVIVFGISCICGFIRVKLFLALGVDKLISTISNKLDSKLGELYCIKKSENS